MVFTPLEQTGTALSLGFTREHCCTAVSLAWSKTAHDCATVNYH